ncbi:coiled-coil domain-containing protein 89 [Meleagris gallopavo]|uniref:coiled-coil domain-containing protein 89 n=1 Tax=Meleagris gallopavo TaxID=9103 RepID=UPI00093FD3B4|nr:coiled-coil domain-containing protein 89 [Meleagris gallopavo]
MTNNLTKLIPATSTTPGRQDSGVTHSDLHCHGHKPHARSVNKQAKEGEHLATEKICPPKPLSLFFFHWIASAFWSFPVTAECFGRNQSSSSGSVSMAQEDGEAVMANHRSDAEMGKDTEDLIKGMQTPCGSPEEKREKALLRARLEEQHRLICILKKKTDDARKRYKSLEQVNVELEKLRLEDAVKLKTQSQRIQYLENLANNHEKMIYSKDEHKKQNTQLKEENQHMQKENETLLSQAVKDKEAEMLQLAAQARELSQQLGALHEKCACERSRAQQLEKELLEAQSQQAHACILQVDSLRQQLQRLQEEHQQMVEQLEHGESQQKAHDAELQAKLERANEEKEQLLSLARERGKALQEKQQEILQLGRKLEMAERAKWRAERNIVKEVAANYDLKLQELQQELKSSQQAYSELSLQFDAYKKHSMDLLSKEKALNVKLRHFKA